MSIENKILKIKKDLEYFDDELEKYEYIIDLGKKLDTFDESYKISKNLVHGCTSQVWLLCQYKNGKLIFIGNSDAIIVRGLVYIILDIFSNNTIQDLLDIDVDVLDELNLSEIITPNRQSGVIGMIRKIKEFSLKYYLKDKE